MSECFVYMLTNNGHTVLYTGMTDSIENRLQQHKDKVFPGFTQKYNCDQLVIATMNPEWNDLSSILKSLSAADPSLRSGS